MRAIVLVDPDEISGPLTKRFLEQYNYQVQLYDSVTDALESLIINPPAALIAEQYMAGLSGLDVASLTRKMASDLPVIILSTVESEVFTLEAEQAGVTQVVSKASEYVNLPHILGKAINAGVGIEATESIVEY